MLKLPEYQMPSDQSPISAPPVRVRPATERDAPALADIINRIIAAGGTTAHVTLFSPERMQRHYIDPERKISCMVAQASDGAVLGFQSLVWPDDEGAQFPDGWAIIASFVDPDGAGRGVGRSLFAATVAAARAAGVNTIDATIRADNAGGLAFYGRLGFTDYDVIAAVPLRDGTLVDRVRKRIDL